MSLLDLLTGGKNDEASAALKRAEQEYRNIQLPNAAQLTLPELQKMVQAGIMTPAQAQAALVSGNAYNDIRLDPRTMEAEMSALSQLKDISSSGGLDAQARSALAEAQNNAKIANQGQQAAILDIFARRGIPSSLMAGALMSANAGQNAETENLAATKAAGDAEMRALQALTESGNLAGSIRGQEYNQEANKAAAENAIRQWNAGAQTGVNESNAGRTQQANQFNTANLQDISNTNVGNANKRTEYNAQVPETIYRNAMDRAAGIAGVNREQANLASQQGQQQAGLFSGLLGAGTSLAGNYMLGQGLQNAKNAIPPAGYNPNISYDMLPAAHGAIVPGRAEVPGDSPTNDKVHALLSPGEVVVPRSMTHDPEQVKRFVQHLVKNRPVAPPHPDDIHAVLTALEKRRVA